MISLQGSQGERGDRGETGEGGEQVSNDDSFHLCHLSLLYERSINFICLGGVSSCYFFRLQWQGKTSVGVTKFYGYQWHMYIFDGFVVSYNTITTVLYVYGKKHWLEMQCDCETKLAFPFSIVIFFSDNHHMILGHQMIAFREFKHVQ